MTVTSIPGIPTDALLSVIDEEIDARTGHRVVGVERRPHPYRTSFPLEELVITLDDGTGLELVLKDLDLGGLDDRGRLAKLASAHDPNREIEAYRMLEGAGLGTPTLYAAVADAGHSWLVVERVPGVPLWQIGEREVWERTASRLAAMHRWFGGVRPRRGSSLVVHDGAAARASLQRAIAGTSGRTRADLERIGSGFADIADWFDREPRTLVHGDFHASNVLVDGDRIAPVDWEMAGLGPGLLDIASLTAGRWSEHDRAALVSAYATSAGLDVDAELRAALDRCRLVHALSILGIGPEWRPPPEHEHDWLIEANRAAERLGVV
jgi:hypothetical protein